MMEEIMEEIERRLNEKEEVREIALRTSRLIIRLASSCIRKMHAGESCDDEMREMTRLVVDAETLLKKEYPDIYMAGYMMQALQEYTEACVFHAILNGLQIPTPRALHVYDEAFLLGLADVVGELRRVVLDAIINDDMDRALEYLQRMEDIYYNLMRFDYPSGLVPIRRKQDVMRALIEKTRGEVAVALVSRRMTRGGENAFGDERPLDTRKG